MLDLVCHLLSLLDPLLGVLLATIALYLVCHLAAACGPKGSR